MKKPLFEGVATALITPFSSRGELDLDGLEALIERQIEAGINAIVIAGTTGEASTLSFEEYSLLISAASSVINHRVPLIAGAGSNDTAKAIKLSLEAQKRGADGLLLVTPYYNKTTPVGLIRHYEEIVNRVTIPSILYHIPGRTGMKMTAETIALLGKHPKIAGLKEASGDLSFAADIAARIKDLPLYAGNDDQILPFLSIGGSGVISVLSNLFPKETRNIYRYYKSGQTEKATALQLEMIPIIRLLFSSVNPIPIKKALEILGLPAGTPRLPLVECDDQLSKSIRQQITLFGY